MNINRAYLIVLALIGVIGIGVIVATESPMPRQERIVALGGRFLTLEIVSTDAAIRQGLSDRDSMPFDHGMLFEMGAADRYAFWMNRMHFPLDIIWIRNGVIVDIAHNLPAPKLLELPARHTPPEPADEVLELNAGQAERYGLRVGLRISF